MNDRFPIDGANDALWMATAPAAPQVEPLGDSSRADVAIVGAGLTGLSAALELSRHGISVMVLEAATIGFGASGRAGGQVNLGLNAGPAQLLKHFGRGQGLRLIELVLNTPQTVFDLVKEYDLQCDAVQNGWVQAAANKTIGQSQQVMANDYNAHRKVFTVLDTDEFAARSGANGYAGGLFCESAGSVQPLSYTRELARVALEQGVTIHDQSGVTGIERVGDQWRLSTADGQLMANRVLICTNGYTKPQPTGPLKGLSSKVVPVRSILAATAPLTDNLRKSILPDEVTFVDKRRLILYMRYDRDGRLCVGDHGPTRDNFRVEDFDAVKQRALNVFPQLEGIGWDYHWGGRLAVTKSGLPFMHEVEPGLIAGMGFNGRGVGMGTMMGRELARYVVKGDSSSTGFPLSSPATFAMHRFHRAGVSMAVKWYALQDHLDRYR
ncbi:MAG: NAD(P)/FAD-dependent oxidoreductase [Granulosicoccus sp.]